MFIMNYIKFIPKFGGNGKKKCIIYQKILHHLKQQFPFCTSAANELPEIDEDDDVWRKIIYNEIFSKIKQEEPSRRHADNKSRPIFLKFILEDAKKVEESKASEIEDKPENLNFPFEAKKQFLKETEEKSPLEKKCPQTVYNFTPSDYKKIDELVNDKHGLKLNIRNLENPKRWAREDSNMLESLDSEDQLRFGTFNPHKPISTVPCGGCGAFLQCSNPSIPGFIPAEVFEDRTMTELQAEICQRCFFLRKFNISLGVNVSPLEYLKILSPIKEKEALVILMVDLLDFPCSIFPGILDIIGPTKPVVIVGNKVDLLIQDGEDSLMQFKCALLNELKKQGINLQNIKHVSLISAKTGYGIEELISQLHLIWLAKGDVYLIGCTNAGKSTLFNTLIQSDYCKTKAINLLHRATISAWPGTTLNLLKFPIMRPTKSRLYERALRLEYQAKEESALKTYQWLGQNIRLEQIPLQGHVGTTFTMKEPERQDFDGTDDSSDKKPVGLNPKTVDFLRSKWFYDTPGVVHEEQIVNLLTASELLLTVPKTMLLPRNFQMEPGTSLFIGGLARLDCVSGPKYTWFTVFASMELPITVTKIKDADYVYKKLLGSPFFRVPMAGKERLSQWPDLSSKKFDIIGKVNKHTLKQYFYNKKRSLIETSADIVLSSAGWVAVTVPLLHSTEVEAWTPNGKGIFLRDCPLIRRGVVFKGNRIQGTPAFRQIIKEVKGYSLTDEPPL